MKAIILTAAMLIAGTASAAVDSIKICNPENKAQSMSVVVKGESATVVTVGADKAEVSKSYKVTKTQAVSADDLKEISKQLKKTVTEGQVYLLDDEAVIGILQDTTTNKYLLQLVGEGMRILGTSDDCK